MNLPEDEHYVGIPFKVISEGTPLYNGGSIRI